MVGDSTLTTWTYAHGRSSQGFHHTKTQELNSHMERLMTGLLFDLQGFHDFYDVATLGPRPRLAPSNVILPNEPI